MINSPTAKINDSKPNHYAFTTLIIVAMIMAGLMTGMIFRRIYASPTLILSRADLPGDSSLNTDQHQTVTESNEMPPKAAEKKVKSGSCSTCPSAHGNGKSEPMSTGSSGGPSRKHDDPWLVVTGVRRSQIAPVVKAGQAHIGAVATQGTVLVIAGSTDEPVHRTMLRWQRSDAGFTFDKPVSASDQQWLEADVLSILLAVAGQDLVTGTPWQGLEVDTVATGEIGLHRPGTQPGALDSFRLFIDGTGTVLRMERAQGSCDPTGSQFTARRALVWCAGPPPMGD